MDVLSSHSRLFSEWASRRVPAELAIVVPTFNEIHNIPLLVRAVEQALPGVDWELVFVDDNSPDGTASEVRKLAMQDARVRIVHRYGRRGLSSACVEGILATAAPYVAVMDGDMQHDEAALAQMYARIRTGDVDLVVGTRYAGDGDAEGLSERRKMLSQAATKMATRLVRTSMSDPMSGFFMITRQAFMESLPRLSSVGFKILLDIAASAKRPLRIADVPYRFRGRRHGESKLDSLVLWEYAQLLLDKSVGHIVPARFISFVFVGGIGLAVHFAVLTLLFKALVAPFWLAQTAATLIATSNNFFLNNMLTYRDQRLRGRQLLVGWFTFNLICGAGALGNVGVADWLFEHRHFWVTAALAGIVITTVWNYAMSSIFTWGRRKG
jgi:dolichol-phosphate mannosyltransferase